MGTAQWSPGPESRMSASDRIHLKILGEHRDLSHLALGLAIQSQHPL